MLEVMAELVLDGVLYCIPSQLPCDLLRGLPWTAHLPELPRILMCTGTSGEEGGPSETMTFLP